jgi:hypothetical protein
MGICGDVAELADALDLGSSGATRAGSIPVVPINRHSTNEAESGPQATQEAIRATLADSLSTPRVEPVAQSVEQRTFKRFADE